MISLVFEKYTYKQIKEIYQIAYSKKFRFPSFMSAFKFYNNYALRTNYEISKTRKT